jgi:hypothetical protein
MPTYKRTLLGGHNNKYHGTPPSSAGGASTNPVLASRGVHVLTLASTYFLAPPLPGDIVTIIASSADVSIKSQTTAGTAIPFTGTGGTQVLNLLYDSTTLNDPSVTLCGIVGQGSTVPRWVITAFGQHSAASMATSNAGISVST